MCEFISNVTCFCKGLFSKNSTQELCVLPILITQKTAKKLQYLLVLLTKSDDSGEKS